MEAFLKLHNERVRLSSRELPEVVETVARAYRAFAAGPGACRWSLEMVRLGNRFGIQDEDGETHRVGSLFQAWATADRLLRMKYAGLTGRSWMLLHAAAVARPGAGAVVMLGAEDAGKSTMACAMADQGWYFLSDEMVPVRKDARAVAFPKLPDAEPDMARLISEACPGLEALTTGEEPNGYLELPERLVLAPGASEPVRALIFLRRTENVRRPGLESFEGGESVLATVQSAFNCHQMGEKSVWLAARLIEGARACFLSYADALTQAGSISALLDREIF